MFWLIVAIVIVAILLFGIGLDWRRRRRGLAPRQGIIDMPFSARGWDIEEDLRNQRNDRETGRPGD